MAVNELIVWKTHFFKNASNEGGAMKMAIENTPEDSVVIHSHTVKDGRMWGYTTPLRFLELIKKNKGLYEVITSFPHKLYFDIDGDANCVPLERLKEIINEFFPNAELAVSGSKTDDKISYHIIAQNYIIHNEPERIYVKEVIKHICNKVCDAFDWKVYTKNRNMKCINQGKTDGRIQAIIEDEDYRHHLITCFVNDYSLPFVELNPEIQETIQVEQSKQTFDLGSLPKLDLVEPKDFDIVTATPTNILALLPINKSFDHKYTHLIARYCYYNGVSFETFLSWIGKKHNPMTQEISQKWNNHWKNITKFPEVSSNRIESLLAYYYPHIKKDKHLRSFINTFNLSVEKTKIETIVPENFDQPEKYLMFNIGMGGGKTTQTINFLKKNNNFCWICPNKALASNTLFRLEKEKVHTEYYLAYNSKQKSEGCLNELENLIIVINSLHYYTGTPKVVIVDEIETLLDKFLGNFMSNFGKNFELKRKIWTNFCNTLKKAEKVIFLDAFITTKTINFIKSLEMDSKIVLYERLVEPSTRTINYVKDHLLMINRILVNLKANKKCFIFYPQKKKSNDFVSMEALHLMLEAGSNKKGVFYNADVDDDVKKTLKDVNKNWKEMDFIITNTIITCGVNYDIAQDFDESYIFVASYNAPRDIAQVSYRVRDLTSGVINVCFLGRMNQTNTTEIDKKEMKCPKYTALLDSILIEKYAPLKKALQIFFGKANYKQVIDKEVIDATLQKQIKELLNAECGFKYENIEDIHQSWSEIIQQRMFNQEATMTDKMELKKYFFKLDFSKETPEEDLARIWDGNLLFFFERLGQLKSNPNNLFNKLKELNNWNTLFPSNLTKAKMSPEIIDEIFKEFDFKYITKDSHKNKIFKEIFNTYFAYHVITITYPKGKNPIYNINIDLDEYCEIAEKYLRISVSSGETTPLLKEEPHIDMF